MSCDIVEITRLRLDNARLTSQLETSETRGDRDAETIQTLRREVNSLNLLVGNDLSKDRKIGKLERENEKLKSELSDKTVKMRFEKIKRDRMENSLSEIEDDNDWLREVELKQRKDKLALKTKLSETKSDLRRMSRSQENLQSRLSEDKAEYHRAEREFQKLEDSWTKRNRRRKSAYGMLSSSDYDSLPYLTPSYRHYRRYLF